MKEWFINISDCCGCGACEQVCPQRCISMVENDEGFLIPINDETKCVDCGLCTAVCPVLNIKDSSREILRIYTCRHNDSELLIKSSSGGIYIQLAKIILQLGGVVFGVRFDNNWNVIYDYAETIEKAKLFMGSKYVSPEVGNSYLKVRNFLNEGKYVLFTGLPCHIAGLKNFLRKDYENLLLVDLICHAVPSRKVWHSYLEEIGKGKIISNVTFRSKAFGWSRYAIRIETSKRVLVNEPHDDNIYMQAFLRGLIVRNSCYHCNFKNFSSGSDITIGDYWEIDKYFPEMNDDRGMSLIFILSKKGEHYMSLINEDVTINKINLSNVDFVGSHATLRVPIQKHQNRDLFYGKYLNNKRAITHLLKHSLYIRRNLKEIIVILLKNVFGTKYKKIRLLWKR